MNHQSPAPRADTFKHRRNAVGRTLMEIAVAADVSVSFLSGVEHGYRPTKSEALDRIEAALTTAEREQEVG